MMQASASRCPVDDRRTAFAAHLRALMSAADVCPADLARACHVNRSTAGRWVHGHTLPPRAVLNEMWSVIATDKAGWRALIDLHAAAGGTDG